MHQKGSKEGKLQAYAKSSFAYGTLIYLYSSTYSYLRREMACKDTAGNMRSAYSIIQQSEQQNERFKEALNFFTTILYVLFLLVNENTHY